MADAAARFRQDAGLYDVVSDYVSQREKRRERLARWSVDGELYQLDGVAAAIVDRLAEDALGSGWEVEGDADSLAGNELDRLNADAVLTEALCAARLDGSAALLVLTEDAGLLDQPLLPERLNRISALIPLSRGQLSPGNVVYTDPRSPKFGHPVYYRLQTRPGVEGTAEAATVDLHESRLIWFHNDPKARLGNRSNAGFPGMAGGALDGCREKLENYNYALALSLRIMRRKQQGVHKMSGLGEALTAGQDAVVAARIAQADATRDLDNSVTVDADDDFDVIDLGLSGIGEVVNVQRQALAAAAHYPSVVLFGEEIKGLGSLGQGEQSVYHARVKQFQVRVVKPGLEQLLVLVWAQAALRARQPRVWKIKFLPLWSPSAKELAEAARAENEAMKAEFEALDVLLRMQVVGAEEIREIVRTRYPQFQLSADMPELPPLPEDEPDGDEDQI